MNSQLDPELSVVVPVYNEERAIRPFLDRLKPVLDSLRVRSEIIFCLDPSTDRTEQVIADEIQRDPRVRLLVFSRRFGQPAATMAGIMTTLGRACVVIDVDLQDPPEVIADLYRKLSEGYEVVYAKRRSRKGETVAKRVVSHVAYRVINRLSTLNIPRDTGDFRIMTRRVIEELRRLNETHGYLRGLVAYVGFRQSCVEYDRDSRSSGAGNYNRLLGSLTIGINGIVCFSTKPLQMMWIAGAGVVGVTLVIGAWYLARLLFGLDQSFGASAGVLAVMFFAGVQLVCLGLMGEYIGRIYEEVKRRPMFIVDRHLNLADRSYETPAARPRVGV
jgi:glycosyltransferase involved in cell wall biosynthesis